MERKTIIMISFLEGVTRHITMLFDRSNLKSLNH